jgi:ribosomal protein S12 methylthiotransferase accessory factor
VAVDLTKPEFGIPVVRVIAPGLEAPRDIPGWLPGRRARALAARTEA